MSDLKIGSIVPELEVQEWLQGTPTTLNDLRDKYVLLHTFQVSCAGCIFNSLPKISEYAEKYGENLEIVGVAVRHERYEENSRENVLKFLREGKPAQYAIDFMRNAYEEKKYDFDPLMEDYFGSEGVYRFVPKHRVAFDAGRPDENSRTYSALGSNGTPYEILIGRDGRTIASDAHLLHKEGFQILLDHLLLFH